MKSNCCKFSLSCVATVMLASVCSAGNITYSINQTILDGSVVGTITTNGTTGVLDATDFVGWNLTLNGAGGVSYNLASGSSSVVVVGSDVTATASNIFFDFDGADSGYLLFQEVLFSGMHYYAAGTANSNDVLQGQTVTPESIFDPSAQNLPETGNQIIATAIPEPSTFALIGLGGIALAIKSYRRRRAITL